MLLLKQKVDFDQFYFGDDASEQVQDFLSNFNMESSYVISERGKSMRFRDSIVSTFGYYSCSDSSYNSIAMLEFFQWDYQERFGVDGLLTFFPVSLFNLVFLWVIHVAPIKIQRNLFIDYVRQILCNMSVDNYLQKQQLLDNTNVIKQLTQRIHDLQSRTHKHIVNSKYCLLQENSHHHANQSLSVTAYIDDKLNYMNTAVQNNFNQLTQHINETCTELYTKMKNVENKMLRLINEKEQNIGYIELRVSAVENEAKNIKEVVNKYISGNHSQKYEGTRIIEQRISQIEQIIKLRETTMTEDIKLLKIQMASQIQNLNKNLPIKPNFQPQADNQQLIDRLKAVEMMEKDNKRKFAKVEEDLRESLEKLQKIKSMDIKIGTLEDQLLELRVKIEKQFKGNNEFHKHNTQTNERESHQKIIARNHTHQQEIKRQAASYNRISRFDSSQSNSHYNQQQPNEVIDVSPEQMRGGIRGLLKKSKEKQKPKKQNPLPRRQNSLLSNQNFLSNNRASSLSSMNQTTYPKSLPPVKQDPKRLKSAIQPPQQQYGEDDYEDNDEGVYNVDEDGFLMDADGNYLYDENGETLRLDQEDFAELMRQQNA